MTETVSRSTAEAFLQARAARDPDRIAQFLDPDIVWQISGPVDVLPYCGVHRGPEAVIDMIVRLVPSHFENLRFEPEAVLIDGDRAASLSRVSAVQRSTGRWISYRSSQFMQFRGDKLISYQSIIDSFDAVEQVLGHPLDVHLGHPAQGNLIAV